MSRRAAQPMQLRDVVSEALLVTARRAADAAAESVIEDVRGAAVQALTRLRAMLPPGILPPQQTTSQQPISQQQPPQRVHYTARIVK